MPALYIPVIVMLLALVFRGVAFEFRSVSRSKSGWSFAFTVGSRLAAFAQGVILGNLIQGVTVANDAFAGGTFDWATPFPVFCGLGVIAGYALLGATWLMMKTEGPVGRRAHAASKCCSSCVLVFMAAVSIWTPLWSRASPSAGSRLPNILYLWPVPVADRTHRVSWLALARTRARRAAVPLVRSRCSCSAISGW